MDREVRMSPQSHSYRGIAREAVPSAYDISSSECRSIAATSGDGGATISAIDVGGRHASPDARARCTGEILSCLLALPA